MADQNRTEGIPHEKTGPQQKTGRIPREKSATLAGRLWISFAAVLFYPVVYLLARFRLKGRENVPAEGPVLLVLNHVSHLDPVYDAVAVHRARRLPRFLAKHTLWNIPVVRNLLTGAEQIPVYRGTADAQQSLRDAHQALANGKMIIIYPDGTITKDPDGWPMTPRPGLARLALEHDIPVVPAARWGTRDILDGYQKKFRPFPRKTVTIAFGEPIDLSEYKKRQIDTAVLREVTEVTMRRVRELLAEIRGETAPEEFYSPARHKQHGSA